MATVSPRLDLQASAGAAAIAESLLTHCATVVRQVFNPAEIASIRTRVEHRLRQLEPLTHGVYRNNLPISFADVSSETVEVFGHRVDMPVLVAGDAEMADRESHRFDHTTLRLLVSSPVAAIAHTYFLEPFVVTVGASRLRRQRVEQLQDGLPLHQDAGSGDYGSSVGLTVFFPLNGCGGAYPGLEVLPERVTRLLPRDDGQWYCAESVGLELASRLWAPELAPGDAVLFDSYCPHRTHFGVNASRERLSCDVRLFARSHAPTRLSAMIEIDAPHKPRP